MRIHNEPELDFDDVPLLPQRTKTASRKDVILEREFKFYHSPRLWKGIPIMVANFDTTGVFEIAEKLIPHKVITVLHKFYTSDEIVNFFKKFDKQSVQDYVWISMGMKNEEKSRIDKIVNGLGCPSVPERFYLRS